jgi:drug/metabolite transporter (DMT)-like permease
MARNATDEKHRKIQIIGLCCAFAGIYLVNLPNITFKTGNKGGV